MSWLARGLVAGNVLVLALLGLALARLFVPVPVPDLPPGPAQALRLPPERRITPPAAALARAAFNADRRLPAEADATSPAAPVLPPPVLVGVVRPRGSSGLALLGESAGAAVKVVRVGQMFGDWRLVGVGRGEARVARAAEPPVVIRIARRPDGAGPLPSAAPAEFAADTPAVPPAPASGADPLLPAKDPPS